VRQDLDAEQGSLEDVLLGLVDGQWRQATASPGWSVADQIAHLAYFDDAAACAILAPERFVEQRAALFDGAIARGVDEYTLGDYRAMTREDLRRAWQKNRSTLREAAATLGDDDRVEWYGPPMGAVSFLSARLMETWAHGTDVAEALGLPRSSSERLVHVARLGYVTRNWSYTVRGEEPPAGQVRLELTSPAGELWTWGDDNADDVVEGSAEEFCLVVTQRRHLDDTSLVTGELGRHWLLRAQAFAGGPSNGPQARRQNGTRRDEH
jgi:uncharacterized protein (TIGR03084 family)